MRLILAALVLSTFGCRTADSGGSALKDDTAPPAANVMAGFNKCVSCHAAFKDPATGKASWPKLVAKANLVAPRINPAVTDENSMPPEDASPNQQVDPALKLLMYNAIKPHVTDTGSNNPSNLPLNTIQLPAGFNIAVYAVAKGARSLALSPDGTLFIGTGGFSNPETKVYAVRDHDGDHVGEDVVTVLNGQNNPNGVAFKDGALYVAERFRIRKYNDILSHLNSPGTPTTIWTQPVTNLPEHSWKYIAFGPDGKLYVPVGAPCNICDPDHEPQNGGPNLFTRIFRIDDNGQNIQQVLKGMRNTVGFDWHPTTHNLWFSDNGRDLLGDNIPPDELNEVTQIGQFFGFPKCHGMGIKDPVYGPAGGCGTFNFVKPKVALGAHVAALGMRFYTGSMFPDEYKNQIFVAEHGSWNSTTKVGAKITLAKQAANGSWSSAPFATGWVNSATDAFWGRPVDVIVAPDGALLVSDDKAGVVYRISYAAP